MITKNPKAPQLSRNKVGSFAVPSIIFSLYAEFVACLIVLFRHIWWWEQWWSRSEAQKITGWLRQEQGSSRPKKVNCSYRSLMFVFTASTSLMMWTFFCRERNRVLARKTRLRKKFFFEVRACCTYLHPLSFTDVTCDRCSLYKSKYLSWQQRTKDWNLSCAKGFKGKQRRRFSRRARVLIFRQFLPIKHALQLPSWKSPIFRWLKPSKQPSVHLS